MATGGATVLLRFLSTLYKLGRIILEEELVLMLPSAWSVGESMGRFS